MPREAGSGPGPLGRYVFSVNPLPLRERVAKPGEGVCGTTAPLTPIPSPTRGEGGMPARTLNTYLPQGERGANGERHYTALVPASATVWRCPGLPHARRASSEAGAGSAGDSRLRCLPLFPQRARPINAWQSGAREVCSDQSRTILMHQAGRASRTWRGTLPP